MTDFLGHIFRDLVIAIFAGLALLGLGVLVTRQFPFPNSSGFPFTYSRIDDTSSCSHLGCGVFLYDPLFIGLDYLFWVGTAFLFVFAIDLGLTRLTHNLGNGMKESSRS